MSSGRGTRAEHMAWCKQRALEYIDRGDVHQGIASMLSDLGKHDETRDHAGIQLGALLMLSGHLNDLAEARKFILGFN